MNNQHPITPPPEVVREWCAHPDKHETYDQFWHHIATKAAQWGADQELEACCEYMQHETLHGFAKELRAVRRPKPPNLKEQACDALDTYVYGDPNQDDKVRTYNTIRRALEALPND